MKIVSAAARLPRLTYRLSILATVASRAPPRGDKLKKLLGPDAPQHYLNLANAEAKPWYLRPTYDEKEILIDPDGSVRGGTNAALVERLTAHEHGGKTFHYCPLWCNLWI
jgi:son of sevenless-like protein